MADLGVGVVGGGFMGRTWAECAAQSEAVSLSAVFGGRRSAGLAADYGIPEEPSMEALLARADVQAVVVTSPPNVHAEQTVMAAEAGKHVLVEKPMARDAESAQRMVDACEKAGVALAVVSQHRFRSSQVEARKLIDSGVIGEVRMVRLSGINEWWDFEESEDAWKLDPANMNVFHDWGAHACDVLRFVTGADPVRVYAESKSFTGPPPDQSTMAIFTFDNGVIANLWMTYEAPSPRFDSAIRLIVTGADGILEIDSYQGVRLGKGDEWVDAYVQPPFNPLDATDPVRLGAYHNEFADFIEAATTGRDAKVTGRDGVMCMRMLEAAITSARSHQVVEI
jgi:predicted dehydrogenase